MKLHVYIHDCYLFEIYCRALFFEYSVPSSPALSDRANRTATYYIKSQLNKPQIYPPSLISQYTPNSSIPIIVNILFQTAF